MEATVGSEIAKQSTKLMGLRVAGFVTGVVGGAVNAVHAWVKHNDEIVKGNKDAANLYGLSFGAFIGTSLTAAGGGIGVFAEWVVARQIGSIAVQRVAATAAVRIAAPMLDLSLTGWGLVLLGAGIIFQVGAAILTPTPLQKWVGRSYFGTGDDKFPKGDWKVEYEGLRQALKEATEGRG